jgi:hypothetical protein
MKALKRWSERLLSVGRPKLAPTILVRDYDADDHELAGGGWPWR